MCPAAARLNDPLAHTSVMGMLAKTGGSLIVGALIGAALTAAVAAAVVLTVATGGLGFAAVLAIGFGVSAVMEATGLNGFIDSQINRAVDKFIPPSIEGKIVTGSANVKINSLPAARAAAPTTLDTVACAKHSSGVPPMIAQGSDSVLINDQPASRIGDMTTCGGVIAEGSADVFIGGKTLTVREIKDEKPWWVTALGVGIGAALTLCGRGKMSFSALKSALPCLLVNFAASFSGSLVGHKIRTMIGNPVNVITGGKILSDKPDFSIVGPLAITWSRFYSSHDDRVDGLLGPGWSVPFEVTLDFRTEDGADQSIVFTDSQGRLIYFPPVGKGESHYSTAEGYYLICTEIGQYIIESVDGLFYDFGSDCRDVHAMKLQRVEDRNGNWVSMQYAENGRLVGMTDCSGSVVRLQYSSIDGRRVERVSSSHSDDLDKDEILVRYGYDNEGRLSKVFRSDGVQSRAFSYENGLMTRHQAVNGITCHYAWEDFNGEKRVVKHWTDDGESYSFQYDLEGRSVFVTDQIGRSQSWAWNPLLQPVSYTDAEGSVWKYEWDSARKLKSLEDPLGFVTSWDYDELGRVVKSVSALGQIEYVTWHEKFNLPSSETDALGNKWKYCYDELGNLISVTDPYGVVTEQAHDRRGLPHTIYDGRGGVSHVKWNGKAQISEHIDCSGSVTRLEYDERDNLSRVIDPTGNVTRYEHDALGRVTQVTHPGGSKEIMNYDSDGNLISLSGSSGSVVYEYNKRGMVIRRDNALGKSVRFMYDRGFRLSELINENGESYRFRYDKNDCVTAEVGLDGVEKTIILDARGLAKAVVSAAGEDDEIVTKLQRDALGRLIRRDVRGRSTSFQYDQVGQLLHAVTFIENGPERKVLDELSFSYNKMGNLLSEAGRLGILEYGYDEVGNRVSTKMPDGRMVKLATYGSGHVHQIEYDGRVICDIERDSLHREISRSQGEMTTRFAYDAMGRRTSTIASRNGGAALAKQWEYDESGEVLRKIHSLKGVINYSLDPLARVFSALSEVKREVFNWDSAANLVDSINPAGYVRHNRVCVFEDKRFEYDVHGRLERKRIGSHTLQTYSYDGEHRLIEVKTTRSGVESREWYEYDSLGRRVSKHNASGSVEFLWSGMTMIQEGCNSEKATYFYEANSFIPIARVETFGESNASNDDSAAVKRQSDSTFYFHVDVSGIPEEMTDNAGEIVWAADYELWGNAVKETWTHNAKSGGEFSNSTIPQNIRFQGQYLDRESGLHYNTFRFYDPDIGRFISPDPIGIAGGINLYQYAPNPMGWSDPFGLAGLPDVVRYAPRAELVAQAGSRETGIARAWAQEKLLIEKTGMGTRNWTPAEIDLIKATKNGDLTEVMSRKGYTGHHINSVEKNGALGTKWQGDPRNIVFLENHKHPNSKNRPNAYNEHYHSKQGHRGKTTNLSVGRLIDRLATLRCRT